MLMPLTDAFTSNPLHEGSFLIFPFPSTTFPCLVVHLNYPVFNDTSVSIPHANFHILARHLFLFIFSLFAVYLQFIADNSICLE